MHQSIKFNKIGQCSAVNSTNFHGFLFSEGREGAILHRLVFRAEWIDLYQIWGGDINQLSEFRCSVCCPSLICCVVSTRERLECHCIKNRGQMSHFFILRKIREVMGEMAESFLPFQCRTGVPDL